MDYKDTLLMPNTTFEMRGNLPKKEPSILEKWEKIKLYDLMMEKTKRKLALCCMMVLHMLMEINIGTAMNRVLKGFCC